MHNKLIKSKKKGSETEQKLKRNGKLNPNRRQESQETKQKHKSALYGSDTIPANGKEENEENGIHRTENGFVE